MQYEVLELYKVTLIINRVLFFFLTSLCIIEGSSREEKDDFYNNEKPFGEEKGYRCCTYDITGFTSAFTSIITIS